MRGAHLELLEEGAGPLDFKVFQVAPTCTESQALPSQVESWSLNVLSPLVSLLWRGRKVSVVPILQLRARLRRFCGLTQHYRKVVLETWGPSGDLAQRNRRLPGEREIMSPIPDTKKQKLKQKSWGPASPPVVTRGETILPFYDKCVQGSGLKKRREPLSSS